MADDKWKTLDPEEYEYETHDHNWHRNIWMLQAKDPNCQVELDIDKVTDLSSISIVEDFMEQLETAVFKFEYDVTIKHLRYLSCDHRLFVSGLKDGVQVGKKNKCKYRQVCGGGKTGFHCTQKMTVEPSLDGRWNTLHGVSNGNLNQLHQLHYRIELPGTINGTQASSDKLLELEFTSLVFAESWRGAVSSGRESYPASETHGIWVNNKVRAIAGKQYLLKECADIKVDSMIRTKRGDQLFTVRYRLVDETQAREEVRLGDVLTATNKVKTLEFRIPQQFSSGRLEVISKKQFVEYEDNYGDSGLEPGDFPMWFFRHRFTIRPSNASCQVALHFSKMDIGSGYVWGGSRRYSNLQHRLSVMSVNNTGGHRIPLRCTPEIANDPVVAANQSSCARMDHTYVSAPGSALAVLFRSLDFGEYEYEEYEYVFGDSGPEVTFGSGWTAKYQQICDQAKALILGTIQPALVKAEPVRHVNDWQRSLPGQLKSDKDRLFRDKRWLITAKHVDCAVQYMVESKKASRGPVPVVFLVGATTTFPHVNETFASPNVTIVQLGTSNDSSFIIRYRQLCTQVPTASPTVLATYEPAGSRRDGETCLYDQQCSSAICSKTLLRCTTNTCTLQCTLHNNQAICKSYASNGCSCEWSANNNTCVSVV